MNIVLIGYRGTGKTVISKLLAEQLGRDLYSIDGLIVEAEGMPVPRIVEDKGWARFREVESRVVKQVSREARDGVIDCGGGVILDDGNTARLKQGGKIVLLTAGLETLLKRIRHDANRPPLKEGLSFEDEQRQILAEREEKYTAAADITCDTSIKKPEETVREIIGRFKQESWL